MPRSGDRPVPFTSARQPATPCAGPASALFFPEDAGDADAAKALCAGCGSRRSCLAGALERREPWGVWGGELFKDGVVIRHRRPRGRPRKHRPHGHQPISGSITSDDQADACA